MVNSLTSGTVINCASPTQIQVTNAAHSASMRPMSADPTSVYRIAADAQDDRHADGRAGAADVPAEPPGHLHADGAPSRTVVSVTSHLLSIAPQIHITAPTAATVQSTSTAVDEACSGRSWKSSWTIRANLSMTLIGRRGPGTAVFRD